MINFSLKHIFTIDGIGASSGLFKLQDNLFIISDNSSFLYTYDTKINLLQKNQLFQNAQENIIKSEKPDFESITFHDNKLYILGSGSKSNRCDLVIYDLNSKETLIISQSNLFKRIENELYIESSEINIEGFIIHENHWFLFQRGNGEKGINGIVKFDTKNQDLEFIFIELPKIKDISTSFTDAVLHENKIYFLASAEDSVSTYEDGEVLGTVFGVLDLSTFQLFDYFLISTTNKFEGLTIQNTENNKISFLLCEDTDSEVLESKIYELKIERLKD